MKPLPFPGHRTLAEVAADDAETDELLEMQRNGWVAGKSQAARLYRLLERRDINNPEPNRSMRLAAIRQDQSNVTDVTQFFGRFLQRFSVKRP